MADELPVSNFRSLQVDQRGRIWILTTMAESPIWYREGERWNPFPVPPVLAYIGERFTVFDLAHQDGEILLAVGTIDNGVYVYSPDSWRHLTEADGLLSDSVLTIGSHAGQFYIGTPKFRIARPFWNRWWFYILGLGVLVGIIAYTVDYFRERRYAQQLEQEVVAKTHQLRRLTEHLQSVREEERTHVARHAQASKVAISLKEDDDCLVLGVVDDGVGIRPEEISKPGSFGILGMRERVFPWNGEVIIARTNGGGTRLTTRVPLEA